MIFLRIRKYVFHVRRFVFGENGNEAVTKDIKYKRYFVNPKEYQAHVLIKKIVFNIIIF
jgi:hypothetical protein